MDNITTDLPPNTKELTVNDDSSDERTVDTQADVKIAVIQPRPGWHLIDLKELWGARELFYFLVWRDLKVRYKQSLLGVMWVFLPPVLTMIVFTVIFGKIAKFPTGGVPYPIFVFAGLLPWHFFTGALSGSGQSIVTSRAVIDKVYFPRLILPFAKVMVAAVDLAVRLLLLFFLMVYYEFVPGWRLLLVPLLVLAIAMIALGMGTGFAALNVFFRDASRVQSYVIKFGLFLTPAIYMDAHDTFVETPKAERSIDAGEGSASPDTAKSVDQAVQAGAERPERGKENAVPDNLQRLLELNPMMGIISSFRAAILNRPLPWPQLGYSLAVTAILFVVGCLYFEKSQRNFADVI